MSAPSIEQSFKDQFSDDVRMYFQQQGSLLKSRIYVDPIAAQNAYFEFIKPIKASKRTVRAEEVVPVNTEHERRKCSVTVWTADDYLDKFDQNIIAPGMAQKYAANFGYALGRAYDDMILLGAVGTAYGGRNGATAIPYDTANQTVAVNYVDPGNSATNSNLTLPKLRRVLTRLTGAQALQNDSPALVTVVYTASQLNSLLAIAEGLKLQGTTTDALATGKPNVVFLGMNFVRVDESIVPVDSNGYRQVICFAPDSIYAAEAQDINIAIDWIPTRKSWLVAGDFQADSARMRDKGVMTILCDETKI